MHGTSSAIVYSDWVFSPLHRKKLLDWLRVTKLEKLVETIEVCRSKSHGGKYISIAPPRHYNSPEVHICAASAIRYVDMNGHLSFKTKALIATSGRTLTVFRRGLFNTTGNLMPFSFCWLRRARLPLVEHKLLGRRWGKVSVSSFDEVEWTLFFDVNMHGWS